MPLSIPVIPMSIDEFHHMEHRLGWKHEYWDGAARLSTQETAVADFERSTTLTERESTMAFPRSDVRSVREQDNSALIELFVRSFDDAIEYAGWPEEAYREDAEDSICSFFGRDSKRNRRSRKDALPMHSFVVDSGPGIAAAILIRSIRRGPIVEPIMVEPGYQRQGLGGALLVASLESLRAAGETTLYSRCHLGNRASIAWHEKRSFKDIVNYFSASHRWRHFSDMATYYDHLRQLDQAAEMRRLAQHWRAVMEEIEHSDERWMGLLD